MPPMLRSGDEFWHFSPLTKNAGSDDGASNDRLIAGKIRDGRLPCRSIRGILLPQCCAVMSSEEELPKRN